MASEPVLVHDYLLVHRGAERTFAEMAAAWPGAPVATLLYDEAVMGPHLPGHPITTSSLQRLGVRQDGFRRLLPLFPAAAERLDVRSRDLVVSSSSAFAHGVRPDPGAVHVSYCYTPFRYAWYERDRALAEVPRALRRSLELELARIRRWDLAASTRVTRYIAISEFGRRRIEETYGRDAEIIHPPVATERFRPGTPEDFLLVVMELVRHKRVDVALEAARQAGIPIKVVGDGPDRRRLETLYAGSAQFLGRIDDAALAALYPRALALVVPNVEEFGIAAVEAQAAGRPVIAPAAGGTLETVVDGVTGILLPEGTTDELTEVLRETDLRCFDPQAAVTQAGRFSTATFQERIRSAVAAAEADGPRIEARAAAPARTRTTPATAPVTVVIPAWGAHVDYLPAAIESLRRGSGTLPRIVVVDNCSDQPLPELGPDVQVVRPPLRLSVGAARNFGLLHTDTEFVVFWDADDEILPSSLTRMLALARQDPQIVAVTMDSLRWTPEQGPGDRWPWPRNVMYRLCHHPALFTLISQLYSPYTTTGPALLRTAPVRDAGGFSEDIPLFEDWALAAALACRGRVEMLREPGRLYRVHGDSLTLGYLGHPDQRDWLRSMRRRMLADTAQPLWMKGLLPVIRGHHFWRERLRRRRPGAGIGFYESALDATAPASAPAPVASGARVA